MYHNPSFDDITHRMHVILWESRRETDPTVDKIGDGGNTKMLTIVEYATELEFYPEDDNVGLSRSMLLKISELSEAHKYAMFMRPTEYIYYTWCDGRVSSNAEIKQIVDGIRDICKGIEMKFTIYITYMEKIQEISIEEIDSLESHV